MLSIAILMLTISQLDGQNFSTSPPKWVSSELFRAGAVTVFSGSADNNTIPPPSWEIPFSHPLTGVPSLAYGIQEYRGKDTFYDEGFFINRMNLSAATFGVQVRIMPFTTVLKFDVAYIAVEPTFPYHLNSFDNIPINLTSGPMVNISLNNNPTTRTFLQKINYSVLAAGRLYSSFTPPLSDTKILLYTTTIQLIAKGTNRLVFNIKESVINTTYFSLNATVSPYTTMTVLHFSMIIFNQKEVEQSGTYRLVYSRWITDNLGGIYYLPEPFKDNFIMGLLSFQALGQSCGIHYQWGYTDEGQPTFAIKLYESDYHYPNVAPHLTCALSNMTSSVFYIKTWECPVPHYYFNYTSQLCQVQCWSHTTEDISDYSCQPCKYSCYHCHSLSNLYICISCDSNIDHRIQVGNDCFCMSGFTQNLIQKSVCLNCSDLVLGCALCSTDFLASSYYCTECLISYTFMPDSTCSACIDYGCTVCSQTINICSVCAPYFVFDPVNPILPGACIPCKYNCYNCNLANRSNCTACDSVIDHRYLNAFDDCVCQVQYHQSLYYSKVCTQCAVSISNCQECYTDTGHSTVICTKCQIGFSLQFGACSACSSFHCITCLQTSYACLLCDEINGYFLNPATLLCEPCPVVNCLKCRNYSYCDVCQTSVQLYSVDKITGQCTLCEPTCTCLGLYLPRDNAGKCSIVCGDGFLKFNEQCDDGNTISNDGCSSKCQIETQHWFCSGEPSCCVLLNTDNYSLSIISIQKNPASNTLTIQSKLNPSLSFIPSLSAQSYNNIISIQSSESVINTATLVNTYSPNTDRIKTQFEYITDLHMNNLSLIINIIVRSAQCQTEILSKDTIVINPDNNLPARFYTVDQYHQQQVMENQWYAIEAISYAILLVSLLSCKIVGVELFGVLQLSFFSLSQYDYVSHLQAPLMGMKHLNGLNLQLESNPNSTPNRISAISYDSAFLNNFNIMFLLVIIQVLIAGAIYLLSKLITGFSKNGAIIAKRLLGEVLLTLVLFNCFNIAFSAGLHFAYGSSQQNLYVLSTIVAILALLLPLSMMVGLSVVEERHFGQFKQKLKKNWQSQSYFIITVAYRMSLGVYMAVMNSFYISTMVITVFTMLFLMYNLVHLPFTQAYQNYRANVCHFSQLIILFVAMYYRSLKSNNSAIQSSKNLTPVYVLVVTIWFTLVVSLICLIYEVGLFLKRLAIRNRIGMQPESLSNQSHEQMNVNDTEVFVLEQDAALAGSINNTTLPMDIWLNDGKIPTHLQQNDINPRISLSSTQSHD